MIIPYFLRVLIRDACRAVDSHPQHDLALGYRHAIYAKMGPRLGTTPDNTGHKRRTMLALFTVQHVLPLWEKARPDDDTPRNLLAKVEQILAGMYQSTEEEFGRFWSYMDGVAAETQGLPPVGVGYAAASALYTAVADEEFDPSAIDYNLTDEDVDPYEHDTVFAAAGDYAGGPTWVPNSDATKRREFWHWWLSEAIPAAWWAVWQPEQGAGFDLLAA